jgi:hypothetical protein
MSGLRANDRVGFCRSARVRKWALCRHADECSKGLRKCMPQDAGGPPRKASFGTLAPAPPQPPTVFVGWMPGMANGPMRAYTSFGTP